MAESKNLFKASSVPPDRIVFRQTDAIEGPWTTVPVVVLGDGGLDQHVLIEDDGSPRSRLELRGCGRHEHWFSVEALSWNRRVVVGFAERVYFLCGIGNGPRCIELQACFGSFFVADNQLLVASGQDITSLDECGNIVWQSDQLGIDGVIIQRVAGGTIYGDGEWDPPGGWRPFAISLANGATRASR